jgi:Tfp pilus assembly protein PilN
MLRTNLSTRPFYNIRAVQMVLGVLGLLVLVMTLFNVIQLIRLAGSERALGARAAEAEAQAAGLRQEASRIRGQINTRELAEVTAAAEEAQAIIDLRVFSWSDLFSQLEATLPENVRLTSFQPRVDRDGRFTVGIRVQARRVQDLEAFLEALEKTGRFFDMLSAEEQVNEVGLINALVEGVYTPPAREAADAATASQSKGAAGE